MRAVAAAGFAALLAGALPAAAAPPIAGVTEDGGWEATLERVVRGVVALHVSAPRAFDTEQASVTTATGVVVDAERGLILTNRHVVHPGPVTAEAVFLDHEEVEVRPVYRDPVHDFGFFSYDPEDVRFMEPAELALAPEAAEVGAEIRVVGNDAGEKLSILAGTLARLDRPAPRYGRGRYSDFNTFYLQAASGASGGSSGSPVVDRAGRVVALNAGAKQGSASSYFLPLDRVVRALDRVRSGEPVPRGTVQAVLRHRSYDELRRLGLRRSTEARARAARPEGTGLLVVDEVVPEGPADGRLEPGDVLLRVGEERVTRFAPLEAKLDGAVGEALPFVVERDGALLRAEIPVGDLHAITPDRYLEMGGGVLHPLSYQLARSYGVPVEGIYVASPGYALGRAGVPRGAVVTAIDGEPVPDLAAFERVAAARADGKRLRVRFFALRNPRSPRVAVASMDRRWFPMRRCVRDAEAGTWPCRASPSPPPPTPPRPATTGFESDGAEAVRRLARSLAVVDFDVPYPVDGVQGRAFTGTGLVVDAEAGRVVVDRDTVPIALGDVRITFAGSVQVPGRVEILHPDHNLAVVSYDPGLLGETPVRSARLAPEPLRPGEAVRFVGMTAEHELVSRRSRVARVDAASFPIPRPPRFRETNAELVALTDTLPSVGGVLADAKGRVRALWASFSRDRRGRPSSVFAGLPAALVRDLVAPLRRGEPFVWHSLAAELETIPLAEARARGLPEEAAQRLAEHDPTRRRALVVRRLAAGTPAAERLAVGDLLLAADGEPVTGFRELERAAQTGRVKLRVLRDGAVQGVALPTPPVPAAGAQRTLLWAGALLQRPPRALALQRGLPREGVYVAARYPGSPAQRYGLRATRRITAVGGTPTPDLDAFLEAVEGRPHGGAVRLRTVSLDGKVAVTTLELDRHYWPALELRRGPGGWRRRSPWDPAPESADGSPRSAPAAR